MAKRNESSTRGAKTIENKSPAPGAVAAPEGSLTETAGNSTAVTETATAAPVAAQGEDKVQPLPSADPTVELDDTDRAAAGSWDDLDNGNGEDLRRMTVTFENGIYLRIGPGKNFAHRRVLPFGTVVFPAIVPDYAKVPGWLCVGTDSGDGENIIYGWVDETLVEDIKA